MSRRTPSVIVGALLLYAVVAVGFNVWDTASGPDEIDTAPLLSDLEQFTAPSGAVPFPAEVVPCEEGLSPSAERRFRVQNSTTAAADDLASQAVDLGWAAVNRETGLFERDGRLLMMGGWGEDDGDGGVSEGVSLAVVVRAEC